MNFKTFTISDVCNRHYICAKYSDCFIEMVLKQVQRQFSSKKSINSNWTITQIPSLIFYITLADSANVIPPQN